MAEFRIQRCLGRGGFGEVYRAVMSRGGGVEVDVAVKVLRSDLDPTSQGVQRLRDEGRLLGRLTHPTILRVYDLVVIDGHAALVSEYVDGDDLARLVRQEAIPTRAVYEAIAQVADALDAAWSWPSVTDGKPLHLVHRDIKPDNIRVEPAGMVKLLDFGIAQARTVRREAQTSVNIIMGSTQYLSPERLVQQEVGPEADVFALGCTLFEALTGEALFLRKSMRQMYLLMIDEQRFESFVADRTEAHRERIGGDRGIALLKAMTAWRKQDRPTAAEVAARCDMISDSTPGPTLGAWCRGRAWLPPPHIHGALEGLTFLTSTSLGLDDPPAEAPPAAPLRSAPPASDASPTRSPTEDTLVAPPLGRGIAPPPDGAASLPPDVTQRLQPPAERELEPTPEAAPSRYVPEETTEGSPRKRPPVLGEVGHRPSTGDLEQVAAIDPSPTPWSAAEMVALYASREPAPPRALSAPPTPPRTEPVAPGAPQEPTTESAPEGAMSTARLPLRMRQAPGTRPPVEVDTGPTVEAERAAPPPEPQTEWRSEPAVLPLDPGPGTEPLPPLEGDGPTVRIQRRARVRADGTPVPRRRTQAEPISAPRFARGPVTAEIEPELRPPGDTTMPFLVDLDHQEAGGEPTLRVPASRLPDREDTWAGALETAPTPSGGIGRADGPVTDDRGVDEVPDPLPLPTSFPSAPLPPDAPTATAEAAVAPPVAEVTEILPADGSPGVASEEPAATDEGRPPATARPRPRGQETAPLLAAGASLAALVLGVGVLLVILAVAWVVRS